MMSNNMSYSSASSSEAGVAADVDNVVTATTQRQSQTGTGRKMSIAEQGVQVDIKPLVAVNEKESQTAMDEDAHARQVAAREKNMLKKKVAKLEQQLQQ